MNTHKLRTGIVAAIATLAPIASFSQTVYIDFGTAITSTSGWNNVTAPGTSSIVGLTDFVTKAASGLSYQITDDFGSQSTQSQAAVGEFPTTASGDFFFGQNTNPTAQINFTGFDPGKQYTFTFLSTRTGASENRSTLFTLTGSGTSSVAIDSALSPTTGSIFSVTPDALGSFSLLVTKDESNVNSTGYFYLNAMKIEVAAIPEPSTYAALVGLGALGLCVLRRKR